MKIRLVWLVVAVALAPATLVSQAVNDPPSDWIEVVNPELSAPREKHTGEAWDFGPFCGGVVTPGAPGFSQGAGGCFPDMWLVVVDSEGRNVAYLTRPGERRQESRNPIITLLRPATVSSMSHCPDSLVCAYRDINVPSDVFGVIILDQDNAEHDFMLAGILYTPGKATDEKINGVEAGMHSYLDALRAKGSISGDPPPDQPFPLRSINACKDTVCFADDTAGVAGVRIISPSAEEFEGISCSVAPIEGELNVQPISPVKALFEISIAHTGCSGAVHYSWDFGDGMRQESDVPNALHSYSSAGTYNIVVTARCVSGARGCSGEPMQITFEAK